MITSARIERGVLQRRSHVGSRRAEGSVRAVKTETQSASEAKDAVCDSTRAGKMGQKYAGKTALVVGAGPSGLMASAYLAKHGFQVKVYERLSDLTKTPYDNSRTNLIVLRPGTVRLMRDVGIKIPEEGFRHGLHRLHENYMFGPNGIVRLQLNEASQEAPFHFGERLDIATVMLNDIRDAHPESIEFLFDHTCQGVDFGRKSISFKNRDGAHVDDEYDLLVAADGTNSFIRQELQKVDKTLTVRPFPTGGGYKVVRGLNVWDENEEAIKTLQPGRIMNVRVLDSSRFVESDTFIAMLVYRTRADVLNFCVNHRMDVFKRIEGHEEEWLREVLPDNFPSVWRKDLIERFPTTPVSKPTTMKKISKLSSKQTVLVGDAGHSHSAAHGWGLNMAIRDGPYLDEALHAADGDVEMVSEAFHNLRSLESRTTQNVLLCFLAIKTQLSGLERVLPLVGKMHTWLHAAMKAVVPQLYCRFAPSIVIERFNREEITAARAMAILKRDAFIFLGLAAAATIIIALCFVTATKGMLSCLA